MAFELLMDNNIHFVTLAGLLLSMNKLEQIKQNMGKNF